MNYEGTIIEESLEDKSLLKDIKILNQKISPVTEEDKTPWINHWTLDKVEIEAIDIDRLAERIAKAIDKEHAHAWYVDFKNENTHYVIFSDRVFKIDRSNHKQYDGVIEFGINIGIPEHQMKPIRKYQL